MPTWSGVFYHLAAKFISTQGYAFVRDITTRQAVLVVEYRLPEAGMHTIGCSLQDDQGEERTAVQEIEVR
ncbi:MAG: hypothetical protein GQ526_09740 [Ardenticatenales bacterium]|nr:hypothetical protein [Ardenticatenales bacterium]